MSNYNSKVEELVNKRIDTIEEVSVPLNDKPMFKKKDFEVVEGEPIYFEPDEYGRSNGAIALISKNTIPLVIKKKLKYPNPYGWANNLENTGVFEKCHIIAYSLSAKIADKRNIFIGTKTLNTSIMAKIEIRVRNYIRDNNVRVLYKATVKYRGNNQIPTGILIEAQSIDDDFYVCEFCYNVQKNVAFNYNNGKIIKNNNEPNELKKIVSRTLDKAKATDTTRKGTQNYIINRKTNVFHLMDKKCNVLNGVDSKYLNETTVTENDLLNAGLKPCKKCIGE